MVDGETEERGSSVSGVLAAHTWPWIGGMVVCFQSRGSLMTNMGHPSWGEISSGILTALQRSPRFVDLGLGGGGSRAEAGGWGLWLRGNSLGLTSKVLQLLLLPAGPGGLGYSQLPTHPPC